MPKLKSRQELHTTGYYKNFATPILLHLIYAKISNGWAIYQGF